MQVSCCTCNSIHNPVHHYIHFTLNRFIVLFWFLISTTIRVCKERLLPACTVYVEYAGVHPRSWDEIYSRVPFRVNTADLT